MAIPWTRETFVIPGVAGQPEKTINMNRQWQAREKLLEQANGVEDICGGRKLRHEEKWGTREGRGGGTKARRAGEHPGRRSVARIALARRNFV